MDPVPGKAARETRHALCSADRCGGVSLAVGVKGLEHWIFSSWQDATHLDGAPAVGMSSHL